MANPYLIAMTWHIMLQAWWYTDGTEQFCYKPQKNIFLFMRQYIHFQCWNVLLKAHFTKEPTRQILGKQFLHHFYPWTFSEQPYCLIASSGKAKVIVKSNNKHFLSSFSPLLTSYNKLHWTFQKNGLWSLIERLSDKAGWEWWIGSRGACFTRAGWPSSPTTGWGSSPPLESPNFSIYSFFFSWLSLMVRRETIFGFKYIVRWLDAKDQLKFHY